MTMGRPSATFGLFLALWVALDSASLWAGAEADRLTPADAEVVVQVNVRQMLGTPLVKKHALESLKAMLQRNEELRQLLSAAGIKPLQDVDTLSLSTSGNPSAGGKMLAVLRGDLDPDKARTAAEEYAKKHPGRLKILKEGDLPMWEITSDNKAFFAAFANKKTLVMTGTKVETASAVQRADKPAQPLNAPMRAALDHVKGTENVWMALTATDEIKDFLKGDDNVKDLAASLRSLTGTLELTDDAQLTFVVHTNSPTAAAKLKSKFDELLPLLGILSAGKDTSGRITKEVLDKVKFVADKNDVKVRLVVTEQQLKEAGKKDR